MWFVFGKSTSAYLWLFALVRLGCGQDFPNNSPPWSSLRPFSIPPFPTSYGQATTSLMKKSCPAPPQPSNGQWRLHPYFCKERRAGCDVHEGAELGLGYQLIYNCTIGYPIEGDDKVYCDPPGKWSTIPTCRDIRCDSYMDPGIRMSNCVRFGKSVKCEERVRSGTSVELSCQDGWAATFPRRSPVIRTCNAMGDWEPSSIKCLLQCDPIERMSTKLNVSHRTPTVCVETHSGVSPTHAFIVVPRDFPWHATIYKENQSPNGTVKMFICGATIIQANFVMTAAHCVYDETTMTTEDAGKLYVTAGNQYRDYDHPPRWEEIYIHRTAVKKVNLPFHYYGLRGNYGSDIALLELQDSIELSDNISPANWDAFSPDAPILQNGAVGKVAGFGRTETLDSSPILLALTAPYVPNSECQPPSDTADNYVLIVKDKFCAGYTNGTAVCDGDSGGGLVFRNKDKWWVMGIVSVSLGVDLSNGERKCAKHALTVYTKVSEYTDWIRDVISDQQQNKQTPLSSSNWKSSSPIAATTISFCASPEQPPNGQWKLHPSECTDLDGSANCSIAAGVELDVGTALIYNCNAGYEALGHREVYCSRFGSWSNIPECIRLVAYNNHASGGSIIDRNVVWHVLRMPALLTILRRFFS